MLKLEKETDQGNFIVGKYYKIDGVTEKGHPILIDEDGKEVDIWFYTSPNSGYIPECWGQA